MATKRPANPYEGIISALFKDAAAVIKDTTKKTQPADEEIQSAPPNTPLSIIPDTDPSITTAAGTMPIVSTIGAPTGNPAHSPGDEGKDQGKYPAQGQTVLRTLDLVPKRKKIPPDGWMSFAVPKMPSPIEAEDGSNGTKGKGQTKYHTTSDFEVYPLTDLQRQVLNFLVEKEKKVTAMREISAHTGISYNSIRKILKVLFSNQLIVKDRDKFVSGKFQGFRYTINESACKKALKDHTGPTMDCNPGPIDTGETSAMVHHLFAHFADLYPNLHALGLRRKDFDEILRCWTAQSYDIAGLATSFEAADWDLAHNEDNHIQIPATYMRKALKRGPYTFPKGFKSRRQIQAEQDARIAEDCRTRLDKVIDECFYLWWTQMTPDEQNQIDVAIGQTNKLMPSLGERQKNIMREQYFRERIYSSALKDKLFSQK